MKDLLGRSLKRSRGFTLVEISIVVALIAILVVVSIPSYNSFITKSRRSEAQTALASLAVTMERHHSDNETYQGAAQGGNNTGAPLNFPAQVPMESERKFYNLRIMSASDTAFTLRATPINDQDGDGIIEINSLGVRSWDENDDGDVSDPGEDDWLRD